MQDSLDVLQINGVQHEDASTFSSDDDTVFSSASRSFSGSLSSEDDEVITSIPESGCRPRRQTEAKGSHRYSVNQTAILSRSWETYSPKGGKIPDPVVMSLSRETGLTTRQVIIWFNNQRSKAKRRAGEVYPSLRSSSTRKTAKSRCVTSGMSTAKAEPKHKRSSPASTVNHHMSSNCDNGDLSLVPSRSPSLLSTLLQQGRDIPPTTTSQPSDLTIADPWLIEPPVNPPFRSTSAISSEGKDESVGGGEKNFLFEAKKVHCGGDAVILPVKASASLHTKLPVGVPTAGLWLALNKFSVPLSSSSKLTPEAAVHSPFLERLVATYLTGDAGQQSHHYDGDLNYCCL
ncbi:hypothetical protein BV898_07883 [Hypsibius exemplaris]|uniref:Homeobox domain-containing protein n=1 Tax=Hypsibius exemplaris TaxID=2072580 RepID=A0A1W0WSI6_HYPEX|nr:hypothetical protein BV898_07883 [Hypsibius exemplaris]